MFISGMIMVTRNRYVCVHLQPHARRTQLLAHTCPLARRYLAWPAFLLSVNSVINQHPLRTKEGGQNNVSVLMCVLCSFPPSPRVLRRTHLCQAGHRCYRCIVSSSGHDHTAKGCRAWCLMYTHGILHLSSCFLPLRETQVSRRSYSTRTTNTLASSITVSPGKLLIFLLS